MALIHLVVMHSERLPLLQGLFHPANEGVRTKAQTGMLIGMGLRPGVSDLILPRARRGFLGMCIEMKAPGKLAATTPEQKQFLIQQWQERWLSVVCDNAIDGWQLLHWYAQGLAHFGTPEEFSFDPNHIRPACNL